MIKKKKPTNNIAIISFNDLYTMYKFVTNESVAGEGGPQGVIRKRLLEIEKELYERTYGFNPWSLDAITIQGRKPEDIDLSKFDALESEG